MICFILKNHTIHQIIGNLYPLVENPLFVCRTCKAGLASPALTAVMGLHGVSWTHGWPFWPHTPVHAGWSPRHSNHQASRWPLSPVSSCSGHSSRGSLRGGLSHGLQSRVDQVTDTPSWLSGKLSRPSGEKTSSQKAFLNCQVTSCTQVHTYL